MAKVVDAKCYCAECGKLVNVAWEFCSPGPLDGHFDHPISICPKCILKAYDALAEVGRQRMEKALNASP